MSAPAATTDKDREDARFALDLGVDYIALSFVRSPAEVVGLLSLIAAAGKATPVIAKIEKPEAIDCIEEILEAGRRPHGGLRGDLGVELALPGVGAHRAAGAGDAEVRLKGKTAIVATQMLESMIGLPAADAGRGVRCLARRLQRRRRRDAVGRDGVELLSGAKQWR